MSDSHLWDAEYQKGGIPSSVRNKPSRVVEKLVDYLREQTNVGHNALDIGFGTGRNSLYLANQGYTVKAMDYAGSQVQRFNELLQQENIPNIEAIQHDIAQPWPVQDASVDVAIDTFVFKHLIHLDAIENYCRELKRVLKDDGIFLTFFASKKDGYYRQFPVTEQDGMGDIVRDPGNQILSRLYEKPDIERIFNGLSIVYEETKRERNEMHGQEYDRESHVFYLRKT